LRASLDSGSVRGLEPTIELGSSDSLRKYSAGSVVAKTWQLDDLPPEDDLAAELIRFLDLYADVVSAKERLILSGDRSVVTPARDPASAPDPRERRFEPKDASDKRLLGSYRGAGTGKVPLSRGPGASNRYVSE
jgi:hypothetical protein